MQRINAKASNAPDTVVLWKKECFEKTAKNRNGKGTSKNLGFLKVSGDCIVVYTLQYLVFLLICR